VALLQHLTLKTLITQNRDELLWKDKERKQFSVKEAYKKFQNNCEPKDFELYNSFWKVKALPAAQHFV